MERKTHLFREFPGARKILHIVIVLLHSDAYHSERLAMHFLLYVRLIGFTAGTLLQLFWMVVILGYRRQRNFERVFFFLCLALFFFYGGSLLALNAQVYYSQPPALLTAFAWALLCMGLCFLPPLLVHLHLEYGETRQLLRGHARKRLWLAAFYVPVVYFALRVYPILLSGRGFDFLTPGNSLGRGFGIWLGAALVFSSVWEMRFSRSASAFGSNPCCPLRPRLRFYCSSWWSFLSRCSASWASAFTKRRKRKLTARSESPARSVRSPGREISKSCARSSSWGSRKCSSCRKRGSRCSIPRRPINTRPPRSRPSTARFPSSRRAACSESYR